MTRKRLLFVQPVLDPPGGSNAVASWMIEALKGEYAISVLTWRPPTWRPSTGSTARPSASPTSRR